MAATLLDLPDELLDVIVNKYCTPFEWREFRQLNRQARSTFARINNVNSLRDIVPVLDAIIDSLNILDTECAARYTRQMKRSNVIRRIAYKLHLILYKSVTIDFVYTDDLLDKLVTLSCDFMLTFCNSPKYNRDYKQYCADIKYMHKVRARVGDDYICTKRLHCLPYVSDIYLFDIVKLYIQKAHTKDIAYYKILIYQSTLLKNIIYSNRFISSTTFVADCVSKEMNIIFTCAMVNERTSAVMYIDPVLGITYLLKLFNPDLDKYYRYINPLLIDDTLIRLIKNILRNKMPYRVSWSYNALKLQQSANPDIVRARVLAEVLVATKNE